MPAVEVMVVNGRIQQCIIDPTHTAAIAEIVSEGEYYGMQSFAQALMQLLRDGVISARAAMAAAPVPHDLRLMLQRQGLALSVLN